MTRRRLFAAVAVLALVLVVAGVMSMLNRSNEIPLDPQNPGKGGSEAVASVLGANGVDVHRVTDIDELQDRPPGKGTTVLVSDPTSVSADRLREIASAHRDSARLILIAPHPHLLKDAFEITTEAGGTSTATAAGQECSLAWARSLTMSADSVSYAVPAGATSCFGDDSEGVVFELPAADRRPALLVIGSTDILTNSTMKAGDNAALGLRALGQTGELLWYSGGFDPKSSSAQQETVFPRWVMPALWLTSACVLLLMFWRGRRLGRLVTEPLPVIVHANETTAARGQLYRKARDTSRTAAVLRSATRDRVRRYLGLPPGIDDEHLVHQVALHSGREPHEVGLLLADDPRTIDESTLSKLADELSALERQVRR